MSYLREKKEEDIVGKGDNNCPIHFFRLTELIVDCHDAPADVHGQGDSYVGLSCTDTL